MTHSFQFDPIAILGVPPGSSLREIRDAYHQKSLKYHPDKGGDEWAFRMVARAYEILSTARVVHRAAEEDRRPPRTPTHRAPARARRPSPGPPGPTVSGPASSAKAEVDPDSILNVKGWGGPPRSHAGESPTEVAKIVAAELLILRFELECSFDLFTRSAEDRNLSCSLHVSWPVAELAERARSSPTPPRSSRRSTRPSRSGGSASTP